MNLFAGLFRLIWGADVDRARRPVLAVSFASSMGGSTVWSFVGLWAIRHLHASQSAVGVAFLISAMVGVLAGYLGGHLSDHVGRRPLILISWACQVALVLGSTGNLAKQIEHGAPADVFFAANETFTDSGVTLQPSGTRTRTVASTAPAKLCSQTDIGFVCASGKM